MPNLRLIHDNAADRATVTASSSVGTLVVNNLKSDSKAAVWRAAGTCASIRAIWGKKERIGGVAIPFCNLSKDATMRVRVSNESAATNLMQYPRQFHLSSWVKTGSYVRPNVALAPDGTMTASALVETTLNGTHRLDQTISVQPGTYTQTYVAKAGSRTRIVLGCWDGVAGLNATYDLSAGTVVSYDAGVTASIKLVKNGWYRLRFTRTTTGSSWQSVFYVIENLSTNYAGLVGAHAFVWHAQLEAGAEESSIMPDATVFTSRSSTKHYRDSQGVLRLAEANVGVIDYDPLSRVSKGLSLELAATNLLAYPRHLDNAAWRRTNITPRRAVAVGPDGFMSMSKLVESTQPNANHNFYQDRNATNETVTFYVLARQAGRSRMLLELSNFSNASANVSFDLLAGTVAAPAWVSSDYSAVSGYIEHWGNGIYLCAITATKAAVNNINKPVIWLQNVLGQTNYTGDGSSGIEIFHAQLTAGSFCSSVILDATTFLSRASIKWEFNAAGILSQYAANMPVIAYDPVTLLSRGLSLEEGATNSIRNNTMQGAAAGTPGTLPTNWSDAGASAFGLSRQIVGVGTENGVDYIDIRWSGTATATNNIPYLFEPVTGISAAPSQAWTNSAFIRVVAGSLPKDIVQSIHEVNSSAVFLRATDAVHTSALIAGKLTRVEQSVIAGASTAYVRALIYFNFNSGQAVDVTLRMGLPQMEQGVAATSPMKSNGAQVTRAADVSSSPQAVRAADVSTSPPSLRPAGYIDDWQSYQHDSGQILACAGDPVVPDGWTPAMATANSYAFGGGNRAWAWLPKVDALGVAIDINDPGNPSGFVEAARLVIGDYWTPKYNFDYGRELGLNDTSIHDRSGAGNLETEIGPCFDSLAFSLKNMADEDLTPFVSILRRVGMRRSLFLSLYPESLNRLIEREHQLLGKFTNAKAVLASVSYGYHDTSVVLEQV